MISFPSLNRFRPSFSAGLALLLSLILSAQPALSALGTGGFWLERKSALAEEGGSSSTQQTLNHLGFETLEALKPPMVLRIESALRGMKGGLDFETPLLESSPLVLFIQDVHAASDVQKQISTLTQELSKQGFVGDLVLEGAAGPIPLDPLISFPQSEPLKEAADYLLKKGRISGPVHGALLAGSQAPVVHGAENKSLYEKNVDALIKARSLAPSMEARLRERSEKLNQEKLEVFNPSLLAFDQQAAEFHSGLKSIRSFLNALIPFRAAEDSQSISFAEAMDLEKSLDFTAAQKQQDRLVKKLIPALKEADIRTLVSLRKQAGNKSGEFYRFLFSKAADIGVQKQDHAELSRYARYRDLTDQINGAKLFNEMDRLVEKGYQRLAVTPEERLLAAALQHIRLEEKLVSLEMTPDEWTAFKKRAGNKGGEWEPFISFYQTASARDQILADSLLERVPEPGRLTIFVAGGFHKREILARLKEKGVSCLVFTPHVEGAPAAFSDSYFSSFVAENTPLEKLFEKEKLFLAPLPARPGALSQLGPLQAAAASQLMGANRDGEADPIEWLEQKTGWSLEFQEASKKDGSIEAEGTSPKGERVNLGFRLADEGLEDPRLDEGRKGPPVHLSMAQWYQGTWANTVLRVFLMVTGVTLFHEVGHILAGFFTRSQMKFSFSSVFYSGAVYGVRGYARLGGILGNLVAGFGFGSLDSYLTGPHLSLLFLGLNILHVLAAISEVIEPRGDIWGLMKERNAPLEWQKLEAEIERRWDTKVIFSEKVKKRFSPLEYTFTFEDVLNQIPSSRGMGLIIFKPYDSEAASHTFAVKRPKRGEKVSALWASEHGLGPEVIFHSNDLIIEELFLKNRDMATFGLLLTPEASKNLGRSFARALSTMIQSGGFVFQSNVPHTHTFLVQGEGEKVSVRFVDWSHSLSLGKNSGKNGQSFFSEALAGGKEIAELIRTNVQRPFNHLRTWNAFEAELAEVDREERGDFFTHPEHGLIAVLKNELIRDDAGAGWESFFQRAGIEKKAYVAPSYQTSAGPTEISHLDPENQEDSHETIAESVDLIISDRWALQFRLRHDRSTFVTPPIAKAIIDDLFDKGILGRDLFLTYNSLVDRLESFLSSASKIRPDNIKEIQKELKKLIKEAGFPLSGSVGLPDRVKTKTEQAIIEVLGAKELESAKELTEQFINYLFASEAQSLAVRTQGFTNMGNRTGGQIFTVYLEAAQKEIQLARYAIKKPHSGSEIGQSIKASNKNLGPGVIYTADQNQGEEVLPLGWSSVIVEEWLPHDRNIREIEPAEFENIQALSVMASNVADKFFRMVDPSQRDTVKHKFDNAALHMFIMDSEEGYDFKMIDWGKPSDYPREGTHEERVKAISGTIRVTFWNEFKKFGFGFFNRFFSNLKGQAGSDREAARLISDSIQRGLDGIVQDQIDNLHLSFFRFKETSSSASRQRRLRASKANRTVKTDKERNEKIENQIRENYSFLARMMNEFEIENRHERKILHALVDALLNKRKEDQKEIFEIKKDASLKALEEILGDSNSEAVDPLWDILEDVLVAQRWSEEGPALTNEEKELILSLAKKFDTHLGSWEGEANLGLANWKKDSPLGGVFRLFLFTTGVTPIHELGHVLFSLARGTIPSVSLSGILWSGRVRNIAGWAWYGGIIFNFAASLALVGFSSGLYWNPAKVFLLAAAATQLGAGIFDFVYKDGDRARSLGAVSPPERSDKRELTLKERGKLRALIRNGRDLIVTKDMADALIDELVSRQILNPASLQNGPPSLRVLEKELAGTRNRPDGGIILAFSSPEAATGISVVIKPSQSYGEISTARKASEIGIGPDVFFASTEHPLFKRGVIIEEFLTDARGKTGALNLLLAGKARRAFAEDIAGKIVQMLNPESPLLHRFDNRSAHTFIVETENGYEIKLIDWGFNGGIASSDFRENKADVVRMAAFLFNALSTSIMGRAFTASLVFPSVEGKLEEGSLLQGLVQDGMAFHEGRLTEESLLKKYPPTPSQRRSPREVLARKRKGAVKDKPASLPEREKVLDQTRALFPFLFPDVESREIAPLGDARVRHGLIRWGALSASADLNPSLRHSGAYTKFSGEGNQVQLLEVKAPSDIALIQSKLLEVEKVSEENPSSRKALVIVFSPAFEGDKEVFLNTLEGNLLYKKLKEAGSVAVAGESQDSSVLASQDEFQVLDASRILRKAAEESGGFSWLLEEKERGQTSVSILAQTTLWTTGDDPLFSRMKVVVELLNDLVQVRMPMNHFDRLMEKAALIAKQA